MQYPLQQSESLVHALPVWVELQSAFDCGAHANAKAAAAATKR